MNRSLLIAVLLLCGCTQRVAGPADVAPRPNKYLDDNPYLTDEESEVTEATETLEDDHRHDADQEQDNDQEDPEELRHEEPDHATPDAAPEPIDPEPIKQRAPLTERQSDETIWDDDPVPHDDQDDWEPEPVKPRTWLDVPAVDRYRVQQDTLVILGSCGPENQNENGTWTTYCGPCNAAATAAWRLRTTVSVGSSPGDQIQLLSITSRQGAQLNRDFGSNGKTLTELKGGTPLLITLKPGDDHYTVYPGWTKNPKSDSTAWYLLKLIGVDRRDPQTWQGTGLIRSSSGDPEHDLVEAIVDHLSTRDDVFTLGAAAVVPLRAIIDMFVGPEGRREIASGLYAVYPPGCRFAFDRKTTHPRVVFSSPGPGFEFQKGFVKIRRIVEFVDIDWAISECQIKISGKKTPLNVKISQQ